MSELLVPFDNSDFGPAMRKLNEREQQFVVAFFWNGGNQARAYEAAGYQSATRNALDANASRLAARPTVQAAIKEYAQSRMSGLVPMALAAVQEILSDPTHKDRRKAAEMVLDRTGLHAISEHKMLVEHTEDRVEKVRKIVELAKMLGQDPRTLLGSLADTIEADFRVLEERESGEASGREGLEDLLG